MLNVKLYLLQRFSALFLALFVIVHIVVMVHAVQGGLSAAEILGRTAGSPFWATFYGAFAFFAALHAAIGVRVVVFETFGIGAMALGILTWVVFLGLLGAGLGAVGAVTLAEVGQ